MFFKLLCSFTTNHHLDSQILYFAVYFDPSLCFLKLVDTVSLFPLLHAQIISNWNEYITAYERSRCNTDPDHCYFVKFKEVFTLLDKCEKSGLP